MTLLCSVCHALDLTSQPVSAGHAPLNFCSLKCRARVKDASVKSCQRAKRPLRSVYIEGFTLTQKMMIVMSLLSCHFVIHLKPH